MKRTALRSGQAPSFTKTVHTAVDFGTTFSAAAYAIDHGNEKAFDTRDIQIVTQYPDGDGSDEDKNQLPTELLYRQGEKNPCAWGWSARDALKNSEVPHRLRPYFARKFKLLLSSKEITRDVRQDLKERFSTDGRTPIDLIVDFLVPLRAHILRYIQRKEDDEAEFLKWQHKWTFTVPADWTPYARREMLHAIRKAKFEGEVKLISEPEAAALYILERRTEENKKLSIEDAAVVGDLGGGTIDCACYLISGLLPLSLSALAYATGHLVGSGDLNTRFRKAMKDRLLPVAHQLERDSGQSLEQILNDLEEWFEYRKRTFTGPKHRTMYAPVPHLKADIVRGFQNAQIEIPSEDLVAVFKPVLDAVIKMLRDQVKASVLFRTKTINRSKFKIEKIFLTGGLAANPYVEEMVKEEFENPRVVNHAIPVVTPRQPETAVVRGAVWRSLHPEKIEKRISDTSYGFRRDESWTEGWPYGGPEPVKNPITGAIEVKDRMEWVVKKGEAFKNDHRVHYRLERYVPVGESLDFEESLYYSDVVHEDHMYYEHPDIHHFGVLSFNLEKWRKNFEFNTNDKTGEKYMTIEYDLISVVSNDNWTYEIEVLGDKTSFRKSEDISAGFKLSQGHIKT